MLFQVLWDQSNLLARIDTQRVDRLGTEYHLGQLMSVG